MPTPNTEKSKRTENKDSATEITLTFEGDKVTGVWYHPELESLLCKLCGKRCKELGKPVCVNINPWCG